ncbi:E3 ubiquitin/ISG15 ligase TRIM25-like [Oreochromis aureus]|uniref:E3 ubiquitin/ISG15 ligase TRIM25-like n=1 Tax=Oreochromis aureus TaxID=47969 RepID=UPI001954F2FA|nr:E3 ubiquitin/ISG15 ligase TRIM25-like [Oreochromis aureus]
MAERGLQLDQERFSCSICLDLLNEPVTTSCGHSFCKSCIRSHWDAEDQKGTYTCPQCRQAFVSRPVLGKNTMLADLVEELKKNVLQAAPNPQHYAKPGDVACDVCTERKLKASKSCLQCMASYCELHLQPHYESPNFQRHKLVEALAKLQENLCSVHSKVKEIFCCSDQQCICSVCAMEEHSGHDTVSAIAERAERQRELGPRRLDIQQRIQDKEKHTKLLQQQMEAIDSSADKAMRDTQTMFNQLHRLVEKRSSDVQQQIRFQQQTELSRAKELQKKLQQELTDLRRRDAELEQLSHIEDHGQFLLSYALLSGLSESTHSASINIHPQSYFQEVTAAVSKLINKLQCILTSNRVQNLGESTTMVGATTTTTTIPPASNRVQNFGESTTTVGATTTTTTIPPASNRVQNFGESTTTVGATTTTTTIPPASNRVQNFGESTTTVGATTTTTTIPPASNRVQNFSETATMFATTTTIPPASNRVQNFGESTTTVGATTTTTVPPASNRVQNFGESTTMVGATTTTVPPASNRVQNFKPTTRAEFLQYSKRITMDQNTAHRELLLSEGHRRVTFGYTILSYSDNPERFRECSQVLSREILTGCCYWEVKWKRFVSIAVAYNCINRTGNDSEFGYNDKSWSLECDCNSYKFRHNNIITFLSVPQCSRVGVYLDHSGGILCFYSVSETMTLIHRVQTTFTQPLRAGLWVDISGSAEFVELQYTCGVNI